MENVEICLWDPETGKRLRVLEGGTAGSMVVSWSPNGRWIAGGALAPQAATRKVLPSLWNPDTGAQVAPPNEGHVGGVSDVAFGKDDIFATSSLSGLFTDLGFGEGDLTPNELLKIADQSR